MANERYEGVGLNGHYTLAQRIFAKLKPYIDSKLSVEANPSGTATASLEKIKVDNTVYEVQHLPLIVQNGKICVVWDDGN